MDTANTAFAQVKAELEAAVAKAREEAAKLANVLLGEGYVVRVGELCTTFDVTPDRTVHNARTCSPWACRRFTKGDAERIAAVTKNGKGETGHAVHVRQAIEDCIASAERVLADVYKLEQESIRP